jgi:hypothetical protein
MDTAGICRYDIDARHVCEIVMSSPEIMRYVCEIVQFQQDMRHEIAGG